MNEITYTARSRPRGFTWGGFSLRAYVDLLRALVSSQLKVRYRYTAMGLGWAIINPILLMVVYGYVFGEIFGEGRANYRLFLLAGLLPWQAFSAAVSASVRSLVVGADLLKKAPFPSELLPISSVVTSIVNLTIVLIVYVVFLAIRGYVQVEALPWVLFALLLETLFLIGLCLIVSSLNVFFRDVEQIMGFAIWIWFFLTPIIYPLAKLPDAQAKVVVFLNPMAVVVTTMQNALLKGQAPPLEPLGAALGITASVLGAGWWLFRRLQYDLPKVA
jgi:lipopolysaccharide transport system permease protein